MSRVYLARQAGALGFSTEVALKVVKRKAGRRSEFVNLLKREAVIGGFLRHPNLVATLDFDAEESHYFIAMEYVEGHSLESLVRKSWRKRKRPFPALLGLDILAQVCRGLAYAHSLRDRDGKPLNIIHRDIKPGNIIVSNLGEVKITDFGITKASVETGVVTATNVVRGTPLYMSPEQATGRSLDSRSDLFSVGLILFEVLSGKRLFEMKDIVSTMESIARAEIGMAPEGLDQVVPGTGPILRKLLALKPKDRFEDAEEVEFALSVVAEGLSSDMDRRESESSLRDSLREVAAAERTGGRSGRTPTIADTENRIAFDLHTIEQMGRPAADSRVDGVDLGAGDGGASWPRRALPARFP